MKRLAIPLVAAAAGSLLLLLLAPRVHPAAKWRVSIDSTQSQARAREISAALGVPADGWEAGVTGATDSKAGYAHPPRFTPILFKVGLKAPNRAERVLVEISSAGDVLNWQWRGHAKFQGGDPAAARAVAEAALAKFVGPDASLFRPTTEAPKGGSKKIQVNDGSGAVQIHVTPDDQKSDEDKGIQLAYESSGPNPQRFEATVEGGHLTRAELNPIYPPSLDQALKARKKFRNWVDGASVLVIYFLGTLLAAGVYIFWAMRRVIRHRFVLALSATSVLWGLVYWTNWMAADQRYDSIADGSSFLGNFGGAALIQLLLVILYVVLVGASDAIGIRAKMLSLRSVFTPQSVNRVAGVSILAGLLCGPLIAALPLAVSQLHLFGSQQTGDYDAKVFTAVHPWLQALDVMVPTALIALFGFGAGFIARYIRKRGLAISIFALLGALVLSPVVMPTESGPVSFLLSSGLVFLAYYSLFQRFDLLAVLSAGWCVDVIWNASSLALQPLPSLHSSGVVAFVCLGLLTGCAALVAWRGRELSLEEDLAPAVVTSQREALMREFSIAHRVQQQMLPDSPPAIAGCTISASCQPAQEVGGDLFDFLPLPDGRWSIGVGDVSGKGVHAALYMTLTKGLLAATTQDSADLVEIIGNVNGHIHAAIERKSFVTMALGAYDPATRAFEHVRAGHNPIVWRRAELDETALLNAPGLGLGIVSDRLFRRSVRMERLHLDSGDALVFYSDGVTEAMNAEREQFGEERLMQAVQEADGLEAGAVRERILARVKEFLDGVSPQDDMTVVVLRVN